MALSGLILGIIGLMCAFMPTWRAIGLVIALVFFFQAEDGIRDLTVTGVQTCALPILILLSNRVHPTRDNNAIRQVRRDVADAVVRSEERRVGKECRSRWSPKQ